MTTQAEHICGWALPSGNTISPSECAACINEGRGGRLENTTLTPVIASLTRVRCDRCRYRVYRYSTELDATGATTGRHYCTPCTRWVTDPPTSEAAHRRATGQEPRS